MAKGLAGHTNVVVSSGDLNWWVCLWWLEGGRMPRWFTGE